jgi:predicted nucleic acid-binding protein
MPDKAFIDTNVFIYYQRSDNPQKQSIAKNLLENNNCVASTQVISEISSILTKKYPTLETEIELFLHDITEFCETITISKSLIFRALKLHFKYKFSFFDSLIISAALETNCDILYSEDMQHGQIIENSLKIINPFAD